jgi:2-methylcitrate dehydratase PrpD
LEEQTLISRQLAAFVSSANAIPPEVTRRAKLLMLDAAGIALASSSHDFAGVALRALHALSTGDADVIGMSEKLALRDAVLLNGTLVHGLDYDDTYLPGSVHLTASCVPVALGVAAFTGASGRDLLTACTLGLEVCARLGAAGKGGFAKAGFHATSVLGTFAAALIASRLMKMTQAQAVGAQGIALSAASGTMQALQEGSWTKRMHPGWAAAAAITAAFLAREGFTAPAASYEGRFGLFRCFQGEHAGNAELPIVTARLGDHWEFPRASIKLYPAGHHLHAFMNAAKKLARDHALRTEDVESVRARVAEIVVPLICEPVEDRMRPHSSYAAQFSLAYAIACCLERGRFGLDEIEAPAYTDPKLLALAGKFSYEVDPDSGFPKFRTGEVIVRLRDGRELRQRESIMPDEPATEEEILEKFMSNACTVMGTARAEEMRDRLMNLEREPNARAISRMLAQTKG